MRPARLGRAEWPSSCDMLRSDGESGAVTDASDSTHAPLARLQAVTAALSAASTARQIAAIMVEQACAALGANSASVSLLTADGAALDVVAARGYPPNTLDRYR